MPTVTLKAHFDGERILLDEPFEIAPDTRLMVTVLSGTDADRDEWVNSSAALLERAFGPDEPDYSNAGEQLR